MEMITFVLGDYAIARLCKKLYNKVKIIKNANGKFYDEMRFSTDIDGNFKAETKICYYVEICHNKERQWVPWENLHLSSRSRPFYGRDKKSPPEKKNVPKKQRKIYEDYVLPMNIKPHSITKPDLNITYDHRHKPKDNKLYENAFKEFVRRGKDMIFDELLNDKCCEENKNKNLKFLYNSEVPTEDKFEMIIDNVVNAKEIENYLHQCWRYSVVSKEDKHNGNKHNNKVVDSDKNNPSQISVHTNWCSVCGKRDNLKECVKCPACFHEKCKEDWALAMLHRKNPPKSLKHQDVIIKEKKLSSTRTVRYFQKTSNHQSRIKNTCPGCDWGPALVYGDIVWNKLGSCPWWPAKILTPGSLPSCLVSRKHSVHQWPVRYYGTLNHSWCDESRMCLFLPSHTAALEENRPVDLRDAVMDACDDYIAVYLT